MYTVKTYVDRSAIEGLGVFAGEAITKGQIVFELVDGFDRTFTPEQVAALPPPAQEYMKRYAYEFEGLFYLNGDHAIYTNHDESANTTALDDGTMMATRDIAVGEEITSDYREFDEGFADKMAA